jgi:hypothetical protein
MLAKLHSYGLLDNDTSDVAETHKKKKALLAAKETAPVASEATQIPRAPKE